MAQSDQYADPKFSTPIEMPICSTPAMVAAASYIYGIWRPFLKAKVNAVVLAVKVAGTGANGINIYKNGGSIGTIICSASAAGYRGTWIPATGTGTATSAIYDTTDTLDVRCVGSETNLALNVHVIYQNQY